MNPILFNLLKWIIVVGIGVLTFMPTYGVLALNLAYFTSYPYLLAAFDALWLCGIALILPIGLRLFRIASSLFVGLILSIGTFMMYQSAPAVFQTMPWYMWLVINISAIIGWLLVASPLWRWVHTTVPVDNQSGTVHNPPSHHE